MESYVLNRWSLAEIQTPLYQGDLDTGKLIVETPYGFGLVEKSENQYQLVRVSLLPPSSGTVSLPWDRIRVLPERSSADVTNNVHRTGKRTSTESESTQPNARLRYISN